MTLRFALRSLLRSPTWTIAAVLCLALGIGANTVVYSLTDALVLHPTPSRHSERLVVIAEVPPRGPDDDFDKIAPANLLDWKRASRTLEHVEAFQWWDVNVTGIAEPEHVIGYRVTPGLFSLLGERPRLGRPFTAEEGRYGKGQVAMLSYPLWKRRFGSDPNIVGSAVRINDVAYTVVGVMGEDFIFPEGAELWVPLALDGALASERDGRLLKAIARLRDGASLEQARAEARTIAQQLAAQFPGVNRSWGMRVEPADWYLGRHPRPFAFMLFGSVAFVLLIACANVANLLLTRATGRAREVAVRVALGATRVDLVKLMLTESLVLALAGGAGGALLALWGIRMVRTSLPAELVRFNLGWTRMVIDGRALAFTAAVAVLTALVVGLAPALIASRSDPQDAMKSGERGSTAGGVRHRLRSALVVAEMALAVMLLAGTGLMVRSFIGLLNDDPGYRGDRVLTLSITLAGPRYREYRAIEAFFRQLPERIAEMPGVRGAAVVSTLPPSWSSATEGFVHEGQPRPEREDHIPEVQYYLATPGYFDVLEIPVLSGRTFTAHDDGTAPKVAIIGQTAARRYWPGLDPVGTRILVRGDTALTEIIGVVGDVRGNPNSNPEARGPTMYFPVAQVQWRTMMLVVRTAGEPAMVAPAISRAITGLDPALAPGDVLPMTRVEYSSLAPQRIVSAQLGVFGGVALLLAVIGIYGVMSYAVTRRTKEIGVRIALGAQRRAVVRRVLGEGLRLSGIGIALGTAGALALARVVRTLLFGTSPTDPLTFIGVVVVLAAAAAFGCWLPARRAAAVDPVVALRADA